MTRRWRSLLVAIGVVTIILISGCSSAQEKTDPGQDVLVNQSAVDLLPEAVGERGTLRVGTDVSSSNRPFESFGADGVTPQGFDIDLANSIAASLGLRPDIQNIAFDSLISSINSDRVDIAVATMAVYKSRQEQVDFVDYVELDAGFLTRSGDEVPGNDLPGACGKAVIALAGSAFLPAIEEQRAACAQSGNPLQLQTFDSFSDAILALRSSRADVILDNFAPMTAFVSESDDITAVAIRDSQMLPVVNGGVASAKDSGMSAAIAAVLQGFYDDGTYTALLEKWGLQEAGIDEFAINAAVA